MLRDESGEALSPSALRLHSHRHFVADCAFVTLPMEGDKHWSRSPDIVGGGVGDYRQQKYSVAIIQRRRRRGRRRRHSHLTQV